MYGLISQTGLASMGEVAPADSAVIFSFRFCCCWLREGLEMGLHCAHGFSELHQLCHHCRFGTGKECIFLCQSIHLVPLVLHSLCYFLLCCPVDGGAASEECLFFWDLSLPSAWYWVVHIVGVGGAGGGNRLGCATGQNSWTIWDRYSSTVIVGSRLPFRRPLRSNVTEAVFPLMSLWSSIKSLSHWLPQQSWVILASGIPQGLPQFCFLPPPWRLAIVVLTAGLSCWYKFSNILKR